VIIISHFTGNVKAVIFELKARSLSGDVKFAEFAIAHQGYQDIEIIES